MFASYCGVSASANMTIYVHRVRCWNSIFDVKRQSVRGYIRGWKRRQYVSIQMGPQKTHWQMPPTLLDLQHFCKRLYKLLKGHESNSLYDKETRANSPNALQKFTGDGYASSHLSFRRSAEEPGLSFGEKASTARPTKIETTPPGCSA